MFVAISQRALSASRHGALPKHVRLMSSMTPSSPPSKERKEERRKYHSTARRQQADAAEAKATAQVAESSGLMSRFVVTAEVTVSKIFPAGFGWQTSSVIAENHFGYAPETMNFAMATGFGDALGVLGGHMAYFGAKKGLGVDSSIDMKKEFDTGVLLASAAFCSGTAWQPLVNALQGANLSFNEVFFGTWLGCAGAFYGGLRLGRTILSGCFENIHEPTYENSKTDTSLSFAIGGATGFFVGTDTVYLPEQNFLIKAVGIADGTPDLTASAIAGTSTALGFVSAQSAMNMIYPAKKCWND